MAFSTQPFPSNGAFLPPNVPVGDQSQVGLPLPDEQPPEHERASPLDSTEVASGLQLTEVGEQEARSPTPYSNEGLRYATEEERVQFANRFTPIDVVSLEADLNPTAEERARSTTPYGNEGLRYATEEERAQLDQQSTSVGASRLEQVDPPPYGPEDELSGLRLRIQELEQQATHTANFAQLQLQEQGENMGRRVVQLNNEVIHLTAERLNRINRDLMVIFTVVTTAICVLLAHLIA